MISKLVIDNKCYTELVMIACGRYERVSLTAVDNIIILCIMYYVI